jgi:hypothetical protein
VSEQALLFSFWTWTVYITLVSAAALWVGGLTERLGAAAIFFGWIASLVMARVGPNGHATGVAVVDLLLLLVLIALALKSPRYWPLWAAGFHLLAVVTHWMHRLDPSLGNWTYVTAGIIWGYLLVGALAFGTWGAWKERRQLARAGAPVAAPGPTRL